MELLEIQPLRGSTLTNVLPSENSFIFSWAMRVSADGGDYKEAWLFAYLSNDGETTLGGCRPEPRTNGSGRCLSGPGPTFISVENIGDIHRIENYWVQIPPAGARYLLVKMILASPDLRTKDYATARLLINYDSGSPGGETGTSPSFTWPTDPGNTSNGFDGSCGDWPGVPNGCFWVSANGWRDAQPFQRHYIEDFNGYHLGADYNSGAGSADEGLPVYATANGTISAVRRNVREWGNIIFVRHDTSDGVYTSMYGHVDWGSTGAPSVSQDVVKGERIAVVGNGNGQFGNAYHLHFEIRVGDNTNTGAGYTPSVVAAGPQSQIDPNVFIQTHR